MKKISSKGKAFPKYQKVFADLKTHLKHQKEPYYEYEEYFSKSLPFHVPFINYHSIFQIKELVEEIFQKYRKY